MLYCKYCDYLKQSQIGLEVDGNVSFQCEMTDSILNDEIEINSVEHPCYYIELPNLAVSV